MVLTSHFGDAAEPFLDRMLLSAGIEVIPVTLSRQGSPRSLPQLRQRPPLSRPQLRRPLQLRLGQKLGQASVLQRRRLLQDRRRGSLSPGWPPLSYSLTRNNRRS